MLHHYLFQSFTLDNRYGCDRTYMELRDGDSSNSRDVPG